MTLSEIVSQTFASCSSDTGMMAELWKREHFCLLFIVLWLQMAMKGMRLCTAENNILHSIS